MKFIDDLKHSLRDLAIGVLGLRQYEAGRVDRLTSDMKIAAATEDADIMSGMPTVRGRVRTMEHTDAYVKKYIGVVRANIPGPKGFTMQSRVQDWDPVGKQWVEDALANTRIEEGWKEWSRREHCTVTGDMSFREFTHLMAAHYKRDGEFLARRVRMVGKYGFQLQALEPDLLDEAYNARLDNGNRIVMGIELNPWRRIVAFHLRMEDDGTNASPWTYSYRRQRIDAREIYFGFDRTRAFQTRGMSALATAILTLNDTRTWEKASLVNARHSAGRLGFLYDESESPTEPLPADETDSDGTPILKLEAGSLYDIGRKKYQPVDPNFPHQQHTPFVKSNLRRGAAGAEVSYYTFTNDYESTNYSSARLSFSDERERWKIDQQYFIEALLQPIFRDWLEMALTEQAVKLPLSKFEKFCNAEFIGRTWDYVDPQKDADADITLMDNNLMAPSEWFAERGKDYEDELIRISRDRALEKKYGVKKAAPAPPPAAPAQPKTPPDGATTDTADPVQDAAAADSTDPAQDSAASAVDAAQRAIQALLHEGK